MNGINELWDSFKETNICAAEIPKKERGTCTHTKKMRRNIGSKLSQTDEIYGTKKLNELQTQETQTKLYTKVHCVIWGRGGM